MSKRYSTAEAADLLKSWGVPFTKGTLEVWRCQGRGPAFTKVASKVFYTEEALRKFATGLQIKTIDSEA